MRAVILTIMTITCRSICSGNNYGDNNGGYMCSVRIDCDNNGEVYI